MMEGTVTVVGFWSRTIRIQEKQKCSWGGGDQLFITTQRVQREGGEGLKVRFGTLTGQVDNAGDDNDRPSY